jgi:hypothetical protein
VTRVRQQKGNNTSGGDNARNRTTNQSADATLWSRSFVVRSRARAGQLPSNGGAYLRSVSSCGIGPSSVVLFVRIIVFISLLTRGINNHIENSLSTLRTCHGTQAWKHKFSLSRFQ